MRKFTEPEIIAISGILKIEGLCLAFGRAIKPIVEDLDLKKLLESEINEQEGRLANLIKILDCDKEEGGAVI
ncbi:MAG TPA: hypothetical protein VIK96_05740 [Bacilli bacterium]